MAKKQKEFTLKLDPSKVLGANISKYSDGYNYASMSFKMEDKERMTVSYEWQGSDVVPEFALNVMEIIKGLGEKANLETKETAEVLERFGKAFLARAEKISKKE